MPARRAAIVVIGDEILSGKFAEGVARAFGVTVVRDPELEAALPRFDVPEYRVPITLEAKEEPLVAAATSFLLARLPAGVVVRAE
jgi:hypothetical protein